MLLKTRGIVLKKFPYSESSLITDIYTEQEGTISCIISGVRKAKSRVSASLLELMTIVEIVVYYSDKSRLSRIKEIKAGYIYQTVPFDVRKNAMFMFLAELCAKTLRESDANRDIFDLITGYLRRIDAEKNAFADMHLLFMIEFADELGFGPAPNYSDACEIFDLMAGEFVSTRPDHPYYTLLGSQMQQLILAARNTNGPLRLSRTERNSLLDDLVAFYKLHIDAIKEINSHHVLRDIL